MEARRKGLSMSRQRQFKTQHNGKAAYCCIGFDGWYSNLKESSIWVDGITKGKRVRHVDFGIPTYSFLELHLAYYY
jgi:hypothetical protein